VIVPRPFLVAFALAAAMVAVGLVYGVNHGAPVEAASPMPQAAPPAPPVPAPAPPPVAVAPAAPAPARAPSAPNP
jgi:hypothetical protein